jgi:phage terminase small subunit
MAELPERHRAFIDAYLRDGNAPKAAAEAKFSPRYSSKLLKQPAIIAEIERRQQAQAAAEAQPAELAADERTELLAQLEDALQTARGAHNASAMVAALSLKSKLLGIDGPVDEDARTAAANRRELITAARLMGDAAESMGLPRQATPIEIVGAMATREFATPEAFNLMRATRLAEEDGGEPDELV